MKDPDERKGIVAVDFDGVIATYDGWKGFDVLGEPIVETIKGLQKLHEEGYYIIIYTCRLDTPKLRQWLKDNNVPYDDLNKSRINPPHTSTKPVWHCYLGDRCLMWDKNNSLSMGTEVMLKAVKRIVNEAKHGKNNDNLPPKQ